MSHGLDTVRRFERGFLAKDAEVLADTLADDCVCASIEGPVWAEDKSSARALFERAFSRAGAFEPDEGRLSLGAVVTARAPRVDPAASEVATGLGVYALREGRIARLELADGAGDSEASRAIATRQLAAYNAQDLAAHCACFADTIEVSDLGGPITLSGIAMYRARYEAMFAQHPTNHAELLARLVVGGMVVDHERVRRTPESDPFEVLAIYTVRAGVIARVRFVR